MERTKKTVPRQKVVGASFETNLAHFEMIAIVSIRRPTLPGSIPIVNDPSTGQNLLRSSGVDPMISPLLSTIVCPCLQTSSKASNALCTTSVQPTCNQRVTQLRRLDRCQAVVIITKSGDSLNYRSHVAKIPVSCQLPLPASSSLPFLRLHTAVSGRHTLAQERPAPDH